MAGHITRLDARVKINIALVSVAISSLFFIAALNPSFLKTNYFFVVQLIIAIPLLLSATLAYSKSMTAKKGREYQKYASFFYTIGYAFIINSIGILVAILTTKYISLIFLAINILNPLIYSYYSIKHDNQTIKKRLVKDGFFISIIILLGVLVVLVG